MTDQGPYREAPKFLLCPRCGELLDRAFDDVLACMRCEGIFITPPTAGLAFGDPAWPADAAAMWWKSSLACPMCAYHGAPTTMAAQSSEGIQIDRCATHGLWLDRGELGRLARTTGNELGVLRRKLHGDDSDPSELDAKREAWRRDVEARRKAAEEENARLAAERQRQIGDADRREAEARIAAEEERRYREAIGRAWVAPLVVRRDPPAPPPPPAPPAPPGLPVSPQRSPPVPTWREQQDLERARKQEREQSADQRSEVVRAIGALENQLTELRREIRAIESQLSTQRARLRVLVDDDG